MVQEHTVTVQSPCYEEQVILPLAKPAVKILAFHLTQFHTFAENDAWWGKGFTEWTNVQRATPLFQGHIHPDFPHHHMGMYNLTSPETFEKQARLAKEHGIYGFCFHRYWFGGQKLLHRPLEMFLENPHIDIPYCLHWANESWTRSWTNQTDHVLMAQEHSPEDDVAFIKDTLRYFRDQRYIRIHGRPLLLIYRPELFPSMAQSVERWNAYCQSHGEEKPYVVMMQTGHNDNPRDYGQECFQAAVQFPPHGKYTRGQIDTLPHFEGKFFSYLECKSKLLQKLSTQYVHFPGIIPAWDNTPRTLNKATIFIGSSPTNYEDWLRKACAFVQQHNTEEERFIFVNAWNEWAEGAHLEPCKALGYAHLNATARVVNELQAK